MCYQHLQNVCFQCLTGWKLLFLTLSISPERWWLGLQLLLCAWRLRSFPRELWCSQREELLSWAEPAQRCWF